MSGPAPGVQASTFDTGFETESISRGELRQLRRRGRTPWVLFFLLLGGAGYLGYEGLKDRGHLEQELSLARKERSDHELARKEAVDKLEKQTSELAALREKTATLEQTAAAAAGARAATAEADGKLVETLKKELTGRDAEVTSQDGRITLSIAQDALFTGRESELGLDGYRLMFRLGKVLKAVKDRQLSVAVHGERKRLRGGSLPTTWELAAVRAVSVARFLTDDAGLDARRITTGEGVDWSTPGTSTRSLAPVSPASTRATTPLTPPLPSPSTK